MRTANDAQRLAIYGKTGSGKTIAGLWWLAQRSFDKIPWIILDFKRDTSIAKIPRLDEIEIDSSIPKRAGLYVVRPLPDSHDEVDAFLWKVWERGKVGLMIDEGYMINRFSKPFNAILTQGRSLKIPVIALSQRPSWLSPFLMSEADFHQVFFVQNPADINKLMEWVPYNGVLKPNYFSYYYDVAKSHLAYLAPVPNEDEILNRFDLKMPRRFHLFKGITVNADRKRKLLTE
jgi:hypothetical protein